MSSEWWVFEAGNDQSDLSRTSAPASPVKSYLPWADLTGLSPQQSAFQRTHPMVRKNILDGLLARGDRKNFVSLLGVHRAQNQVDMLRARQGRPSPYAHPVATQPWHNPMDSTMKIPQVMAARDFNEYDMPDEDRLRFVQQGWKPRGGEESFAPDFTKMTPAGIMHSVYWDGHRAYETGKPAYQFESTVPDSQAKSGYKPVSADEDPLFETDDPAAIDSKAKENERAWLSGIMPMKPDYDLASPVDEGAGPTTGLGQFVEPKEKLHPLWRGGPDGRSGLHRLNSANPELTVKDYDGTVGNNNHITRNEQGMIPLDWVRNMKGLRGEVPGEHRNADEGPEWEDFKSHVAAGTPGYADPIFIMVEHGGQPAIAEGNHRRDAHAELGHTHLPAEIRYFGHAEKQGTVGERAGMPRTAGALDESGLKAAGIAVIAMDTGRVLMQQRALNPMMCPCGMGVTWDEMNGYQHDDGSVSHDDSDLSVSEMLDQGHDAECSAPGGHLTEDDDEDYDGDNTDGGENESDEAGLGKTAALEFDPNEGTWEFPGGKLDPGESPRQAAIREFREEVGQDLPAGVFVGAWVSPGGITVAAALGKLAVQPGDQSYGFQDHSGHTAPSDRSYAAPLHDVESMMPGFYDGHSGDYSHGNDGDAESISKILGAHGQPDKKIRVYRAVPHGISKIYGRQELSQMFPDHDPNNLGEWVGISRDYALEHARAETCPKCGGHLQVISGVAKAKDLLNEGYPTEWGYVGDATLDHSGANKVYKTKCPAPRRVPKTNDQLEAEYDVVKHQGQEAVEQWEKENEADRMLRLRPRRSMMVEAEYQSTPNQDDIDWLTGHGTYMGWQQDKDFGDSNFWSRSMPNGHQHFMIWSPLEGKWGGDVVGSDGRSLLGSSRPSFDSARAAHHGLNITQDKGTIEQQQGDLRAQQVPESFQGYKPESTVEHIAPDFAVKHDLFQRLNSAIDEDDDWRNPEGWYRWQSTYHQDPDGETEWPEESAHFPSKADRETGVVQPFVMLKDGDPDWDSEYEPSETMRKTWKPEDASHPLHHQAGQDPNDPNHWFLGEPVDDSEGSLPVEDSHKLQESGWTQRPLGGQNKGLPHFHRLSPSTGIKHVLAWDYDHPDGRWLYNASVPNEGAPSPTNPAHRTVNPGHPGRLTKPWGSIPTSTPEQANDLARQFDRDYIAGNPEQGEPGIKHLFNDRSGSPYDQEHPDFSAIMQRSEPAFERRREGNPLVDWSPEDPERSFHNYPEVLRSPDQIGKRVMPAPGQPWIEGLHDFSLLDEPPHMFPFGGMEKLNKVAKAPVYKGFIYLIQNERDIDLGNREIANPDDPDGDMSEQSAWWDIEHAKKNPALRRELKSIPWDELELWADKSVRTNRQVISMVTKLAESEYAWMHEAEQPEEDWDEDEEPQYEQGELFPLHEPHHYYNSISGRPGNADAQALFASQKAKTENDVAGFKQMYQNSPDAAPNDMIRDRQLKLLGPEWNYTKGKGGFVRSAYKNVDGVSHHVTVTDPIWRGGPNNHEALYHHQMLYPTGETAARYVGDIDHVFNAVEGQHRTPDDSELWPSNGGGRWGQPRSRAPFQTDDYLEARGDRAARRADLLDNDTFDPERHKSFPDSDPNAKPQFKQPQFDMLHNSTITPMTFQAGSISGRTLSNGDYQWSHYRLPIATATKDANGDRSITMASEGRDWPGTGGWGPSTRSVTHALHSKLKQSGYHVKWDDDVLPSTADDKELSKAGFQLSGGDYVRTAEGRRGNLVHHRIIPLGGQAGGQYQIQTYVNGLPKRVRRPKKNYYDSGPAPITSAHDAIIETNKRHRKYGMPLTQDVPVVNKVIRPGTDEDEGSEGARVHDVTLPSGDWIAKTPQHRHINNAEYRMAPDDEMYFLDRAGEDANMEEFSSKLGRALSDPNDEPLTPEVVRGQKATDPSPTVYVRKYPDFTDMEGKPGSDDHVNTPRGQQLGYLHSVLGDGDKVDHHNMGLTGGKPVSIDHTLSSLGLYADARAGTDPDLAHRMEWHHEFGLSPYEKAHFLGHQKVNHPTGSSISESWRVAPKQQRNPLAPQDTERAVAASETMRPWAQARGVEPWLDAAQHRMRMLGTKAGGTSSMFPYQMAHEQAMQRTAIAPLRASWPLMRDLISAGKPRFSVRTPDQVDPAHHDMIVDSVSPNYHEEDTLDQDTPKLYAVRSPKTKETTFLAPLVHNQTGKTGWVRGRTDQDPSEWQLYQDHQLSNAVAGREPDWKPPVPRTPREPSAPKLRSDRYGPAADARAVRPRATGKPMSEDAADQILMAGEPEPQWQEGDVPLDEEGHQLVEPKRDTWTEPEGRYPWDFDWDKPGDHPLVKREDEWWKVDH